MDGPAKWYYKMYQKVHNTRIPVFIHSCGYIRKVLSELIEVGINVLISFQLEVMDIYEIKKDMKINLHFMEEN